MQKRLIIIRHGKSSWDSEVKDIDRPLTERGVRNAYEMARRVLDRQLVPEMICTSVAARALHTAVIMAREWEIPEQSLVLKKELYMPEIPDIIALMSDIPNEIDSVAIFGHNPAFTYFANLFLRNSIDDIPTTGVVVLHFETVSWKSLKREDVVDELFLIPDK